MELRFIIRDGKKILQFRDFATKKMAEYAYKKGYSYSEWQDVPLVEETQ